LHLKCCDDSDSLRWRAAEASAVSNFFVNVFLPTNGHRQYVFAGDLNEDILRPPSGSLQPIQRITNGLGLTLTTPTNSLSSADRTFSIRTGLTKRFDYVLPSSVLLANIRSSVVYRSDLSPQLAGVLTNDSATASTHLPVLMEFNYPDPALTLAAFRSNGIVWLSWLSLIGRRFTIEGSSNVVSWTVVASNLVATETTSGFAVTNAQAAGFFRLFRSP
jgi:hypothetical protein